MAEKSQKKKNCAFHRWGCLVQLWSCQLPHYAYFFPYSTVATWINPIKMAENRGGLYFIPTSPRYWNQEGARLSRCSPCSLQNPTSRRLVWARGTGLPSQGGDMSVNAQQPPGREAAARLWLPLCIWSCACDSSCKDTRGEEESGRVGMLC